MSALTPEQRGDLAEQMLPVAAHLAVLVHGDGGRQDVAEVLAGLDDAQKNALLVVLAGLVDPEQPVGKALGWIDFDEYGALTVPASWSEQGSVRDLVPQTEDDDDEYVDLVAVDKYIRGKTSVVTPRERLEAVRQAALMGISYQELDAIHKLRTGSTCTFVSRARKRFAARGEDFPEIARPSTKRDFTEAEVVEIRERAAAGATQIELALAFGVVQSTIRNICRGSSYAQFGGPILSGRHAKAVKASQEFGWGHADGSLAGGGHKRVGEAA